ncbi:MULTISPECIES: multifunctional CCA addition/repair protein [Ferrimonas]|uniref:multifunctional CCA addition/repair protein n=1 Tax=Ferrimonas TaxID=44011 RepID=UPI000485A3F6|nr:MULTISPECIES: multifunctional CCA addition/repair protein [Ferrimonas]USD37031.1 multifunctional CCA addition/repair protein [Ferrimonas sp. SCSIO 43195]
MQIYLVGGAVRDQLLGLEIKDRDHVVVGATPEQMLAQGYQQVGKSFPVFLHPDSHQEYALARTERKAGHGYTGFDVCADPSVTLEADLLRRDLTINAIAQAQDGSLTDPYGGQQDLEKRLLRHVSGAFVEDPLRVLRVARFAARFHSLGFTVADETLALMRQLAESGELAHLTPERVWSETERALCGPTPRVYFEVLHACGALTVLMPELAALAGVPQPPAHHPEVDSLEHTLLTLNRAAALSPSVTIRFAALVHDLGKALTPREQWPQHIRHEQLGREPLLALCQRLKVPNACAELAEIACVQHLKVHRAKELKPQTLLKLFDRVDAWRKPERFADLLLVCQADAQGRQGFEQRPYPQADYLSQALAVANRVQVRPIVEAGFKGPAIKAELARQRIEALSRYKADAQ